MSAEVVKIGKAKANERVIKILEELLDEARRGELQSISYVAECVDGSFGHGHSACDDLTKQLMHMARLVHLANVRLDKAQRVDK